jgi:diguanylate cyclase (GGDEF)-like protein/PAS domain S-box-containing protein
MAIGPAETASMAGDAVRIGWFLKVSAMAKQVLLADDLPAVRAMPERGEAVVVPSGSEPAGKEMAEALRLAEAALALVHEAVLVLDRDGCIVRINQNFVTLTGYGEDEILGWPCRLFHDKPPGGDANARLLKALAEHGRWHGDSSVLCRDGSVMPIRLAVQAVPGAGAGAGREVRYVAVFSDLRRNHMDQSLITQLARHDTLTGLPNWDALHEQLERMLPETARIDEQLAVLLLDLDRFKAINDAMGHVVGDYIIATVAARLKASIGERAILARRSGDEFCLLLPATDSGAAAALARSVMDVVAAPIELDRQEYTLTASIGISLFPQHGDDAAQLLRNAGAALHLAKHEGRNGLRFFSEELSRAAQERRAIEAGLRHAIERDEFFLCYQPQLNLAYGGTVGVEALVRWRNAAGEIVPPARFIPVAEQTGQILAIGEWVLRAACRQGKVWHQAGYNHLLMAVNLSPCQFRQDDLLQRVGQVLAETRFPAEALELEITEGVLMENPARAERILIALREMGISVSVDDFGTGYSSLAYLKRFPLDRLKIDRSFVRDCCYSRHDSAIVDAVIGLARNLGLGVIAEGVESADQLAFLRKQGCDEVQGFYLSPPLAVDELTRWLSRDEQH